MTVNENRKTLKALSSLGIDAQFIVDLGSKVFSFKGEKNEEYAEAVNLLKDMVVDLETSLNTISNELRLK